MQSLTPSPQLALAFLIFTAIPCLAADYDPNVTLSIDVILVEIGKDQVSPIAKLTAKDVLLLAADPEKSKILARHQSVVSNVNRQQSTYNQTISIPSTSISTSSKESPVKTVNYALYDIRQEFQYHFRKLLDSNNIHLELNASISWPTINPDANAPPIINRFDSHTYTSANPGQPVIASAMQGQHGMQYLIAIMDEAKP